MVIQCSQCDTRFKVADEKLKPGGIKVRCSKCRHIFTVMPPEPEKTTSAREDEIDFGAFNMEPVPEEPTTAGTAPEPDLAERGKAEADSTEPPIASKSTREAPAEFDFEKEPPTQQGPVEFDFEEKPPAQRGPSEFDFEEEPPSQQSPMEFDFEEEATAQQGPVEFDFEEEPPSQQSPVEFDFEEEATAQQGPVEFELKEDSTEEPASTEFDLEEEPSLEQRMEFGFEDEDTDGSAEFSFEETDPFSDREAEETAGAEKGAGAPEDFVFGDKTDESSEIDDFDLSRMSFGDEEPAAPQDVDVSSIPMEEAPEIDEKKVVPAQPKKSREPAEKAERASTPAASPRRKSPFKGVLVFVLVLLLALCGVAGYFFWQRGNLDIVKIVEQFTGQGTPASVAGQIRLSELSSSFVTNREAGQLFVIQGKATNDYSEARSAIAVKGILYDKNGQALLQQTVFCGNSLDVEVLRNMPFAKIEESMNNQFGDSLSNLNIGPGKSIPFTIVFKNLPAGLAEYTVEAVDSKPGSKP
jgi:predicted Zn finger-like uncharacterized protein